MYSYPPSLDLDALTTLANAARQLATGAAVDKAGAAQASWDLIGYGLSKGLPVTAAGATPKVGATELNGFADTLDQLKGAGGDQAKMQALNPNWGNLLKIALSILAMLLGGASPIVTP